MTRAEIESEYRVENGIIRSPGKFEGEAVYVPYFYDAYLNGGADQDNGEILRFRVNAEEKDMFPELKRRRWVAITEGSQGFVVEV